MAEVAPMDAALHAKIMRAWHGEDEVSSMALPDVGSPIDMGQIRTEVKGSGQVSLNDADFRALINKNSGQEQSLYDYYGKSAAPPEVFIWKAGASGASCHAVRPPEEQVYGYLNYGGSDKIRLDYQDRPPEGIYIYGSTDFAYSRFNGQSSGNVGGNTAQYNGRWDGNGYTNGAYGRFPCSLPNNHYWNGFFLDSSKYGLEYKWHTRLSEQVLGYAWSCSITTPGGSASTSSGQMRNGWMTHIMNVANARGGYAEFKVSNSQYSNGGGCDMHLVHIKAVPVKVNSCSSTPGQSRLHEILTEEEYRRYQIWMGQDPDATEPEPITPEQWLAENPGQTLPDPDAEPEFPKWRPEA